MRASRRFLRFAIAAGVLASAGILRPSAAMAEEPSSLHGTLFRWSGTPNVTGGPDLSEPLVTDRPGFTNPPVTVGKGVLQLEAGYTYTYDDQNHESVRTNSWGEPLLRYGILADWLELRLNLNPLQQRTRLPGFSETTAGTEDLLVGFKVFLTPQAGALPAMGLFPEATIPTGSPAFTNDEILPSLTWAYSWELTDRLGVGGNTVFGRTIEQDTAAQDAYAEMAQSVSIDYGLTDELGSFYEWYALFPHNARETQVRHVFDTGLTYLVTDDWQWDLSAGWGLNEPADDFFASTGLSIRF